MTLRNFKHISASSLNEATDILSKVNGKAVAIAGGTDLLGVLKDKIHAQSPEILVDLKTIPDLSYVKTTQKGIHIGALTTLTEICQNDTIKEQYGLLAQAALTVASPQLRNMGTLGGNICQEPRCWYYRAPDDIFHCLRKGGTKCGALLGDNRYHSIFGSVRVAKPACSETCPGSIEIPAYMDYVRNGDLDSAALILLANNPIPSITGRICPHLCESQCNRSEFDGAVSIRNVERVVGDYILDNATELLAPPQKELKESVAIIGAGPAGLSAAYFLRKAGYKVIVYEKMPQAGGMLTYGIPADRLAKDVIKRQIKAFEAMGIEFKFNTTVGENGITLTDLQEKFENVFLASGAWGERTLAMEKAELLTPGIDFLAAMGLGEKPAIGKKVLVIGGGNVAVDVAVTASRLGAEQVTMVCLESRDTMPAFEEEIAEALHEGVTIQPSFGPDRIIEENGSLTGLEVVSCTSVFDENGRFNPSFDTSVKQMIEADQIILAIGQSTDISYTGDQVKNNNGWIVIDEKTRATNLKGVYAGGDVTSGPASVIHAVAAGRETAYSIADIRPESNMPMGQSLEVHFESHGKCGRTQDIKGIDDIRSEAQRCVNCGCIAVNASDMAPALMALGAKIKTTKRILSADDFFAADIMKCTILDHDELVEEIEIPAPETTNRQGYQKFRIRNAIDFPIVSLAYSFDMDGDAIKDANIVFGAVAPIPLRAQAIEDFLEGKKLEDETGVAAGEIAAQSVKPLLKNAFKVQIVKALLKKVLV
ncbi:MAG: FAD-dependent oxidoreductase [Desulfobacula sp.]|jgi:NADPH-dependent glutamate synthase beta subunit-like oxidoreductase|uniref:FAD-dependent oxidoreductase n=1 Tax=Desulfobacula sp. TaxID=2593537 RepID=UPI001EC0A233|nr:FAD-dependent oxidoreductase [Desulfobacula sp.]MBT3807049.1 FAD-dependent oxidoreductase [Desulfobacula sp.]MBT4200753.1 FAD-dependent oxidoreductase [Desulfobacula sp.]